MGCIKLKSISPLTRLVLFLVALSILSGLVAGIAASVPALSPHNAVPDIPTNSVYMDCVYGCINQYNGQNMPEVQACGQVCYQQAMNNAMNP